MDEHDARIRIAKVAACLWQRGLVAGASGNISVRLRDGSILVTPTLRSLRNVAPAEIVLLERDGKPRDSAQRPTSELPLHLAAYGARPDIVCIVHTHPTYCVAWSKTGTLFPLDTVGAMESLGTIVFAPYAQAGSAALAERCAAAFAAGADSVVMERHGLTSVAATLERAFELTDLAEQTAQIETLAAGLAACKGKPGAGA